MESKVTDADITGYLEKKGLRLLSGLEGDFTVSVGAGPGGRVGRDISGTGHRALRDPTTFTVPESIRSRSCSKTAVSVRDRRTPARRRPGVLRWTATASTPWGQRHLPGSRGLPEAAASSTPPVFDPRASRLIIRFKSYNEVTLPLLRHTLMVVKVSITTPTKRLGSDAHR